MYQIKYFTTKIPHGVWIIGDALFKPNNRILLVRKLYRPFKKTVKYSSEKIKETVAYWKLTGKPVHYYYYQNISDGKRINESEFWELFDVENT